MEEFNTYQTYQDTAKIVYTIPEIETILGISGEEVKQLLDQHPFPILTAVRMTRIPIQPFHRWVQETFPSIELPKHSVLPSFLKSEKQTYSVPEVRAMLGMKKTSSYKMIKIGTFKTILVNDRIRILRSSFEDWFHSQDDPYIDREEA